MANFLSFSSSASLAFKSLLLYFSHLEGVHNYNPPSLFLLHFSVGIVHHLLGLEGGLNGLKRIRDTIKFFFIIIKKIKKKI